MFWMVQSSPAPRIDSFQADFLFLYYLKTSENHRISYFFRGYRNTALARSHESTEISYKVFCTKSVFFFWFLEALGSFNQYLRKVFRKNNFSYPLIRLRTCKYAGIRNVSFFGKFCVRTK